MNAYYEGSRELAVHGYGDHRVATHTEYLRVKGTHAQLHWNNRLNLD